MIKVANTPEKVDKCLEFLKDHFPIKGTHLLYTERDGIITACAGYNPLETGGQIEPFVSNFNADGYRLFYIMCGIIMNAGHRYIRAITQNENAIKILIKNGFILNNPLIKEYIYEVL